MSAYEAAVYREDTDELALVVKAAVEERTAHVTDARIKRAIIASATVTAMQLLDGGDLERDEAICPGGFAEAVERCIQDCRKRWGG